MFHVRPPTMIMLVALAACAANAPSALASLPPDQTIQYIIREAPEDPESDPVFLVELTVVAANTNGLSVGWEAVDVVLMELDSNGVATSEWIDTLPEFDVSNGVWWVEHGNPESPELKDFARPPAMAGTADAESPAEEDLDYAIEGQFCDASCQQLFGGYVGALDYEFIRAGEQAPILQATAEALKIDDDIEPPAG